MPGLSDYAENKLLDHLLGVSPYTPPASVWLALFLSDPTDTGSGTEVSGNSYQRIQATFGAAVNGATSNASELTFPTPTGLGWGDVTHAAIFDAQSNGNMLFSGQLSQTKTVGTGTLVKFLVGSVVVTLT